MKKRVNSIEFKKMVGLQFFAESGGSDEGAGSGAAGAASDTGTGASGKTFSQEEVNKMMATEKEQGRRAVLNDLGVKDPEALKQIVESYNQQKQKDMTPDQKLQDDLANKANENETLKMQLSASNAKVQAMMLGAKPESVDDVIALTIAKDPDGKDFKATIAEIRTKYPAMFNTDGTGAAGDEGDQGDKQKQLQKAGQKGTGGGVGSAGGAAAGAAAQSIGARLAASRKVSAGKSSYFSK